MQQFWRAALHYIDLINAEISKKRLSPLFRLCVNTPQAQADALLLLIISKCLAAAKHDCNSSRAHL